MSYRGLSALAAAALLTCVALPRANAQQTPNDSAGAPDAATARDADADAGMFQDGAVAEASKRVARADQLAATRRYSEALKEYRYALSQLKKAGRGDAELRARVRRLSRSLAVVRFDVAAVPDGSYVELAVDERVVPAGAVRNGWFVRGGTMKVTARRPGCDTWESELTLEAGATKTVKVPALKCRSGEVADMAGWADKKYVRAVSAGGTPTARSAAPWLFRPDSGKRVGSRRGLLIWGSILTGGAAAIAVFGDSESDSVLPAVLFPTMGVTGIGCLAVYLFTMGGDDGDSDRLVVAPVVGEEAGTGVAFSWSGRW